jgi:bacillithiol system protein YtxJ
MHKVQVPKPFAQLATSEQFTALMAESAERPVVIFKHSPACGTSAQAYDELESFLQENAQTDVFLVNVLSNRQLSRAIAEHVRVRHESPQVLVLRAGEVRWHGSHFRVTSENVRKALRDAAN